MMNCTSNVVNVDIDDCVSLPCQNGGTCIDRVNGFNCSCTSEYEGIYCEKEVLSRETEVQVNENESALLICVVYHMDTTSTLFWTRSVDNTSVVLSEYAEGGARMSPNLFFANIKWSDEGTYTCHVQTVDGMIDTNEVRVLLNTSTAMCPCRCAYRRKLEYWASKIAPNKTLNELLQDLQPVIRKIKVELSVKKSKLSLEISKHISAVDNRKSSQTIGVVGAVLIIIVLGVILLLDFSTLLYHFRTGFSPRI
ncbi:unnamed protein product [Mytilus coruscus]|uniref:Ig-like domain-containing protein n=1 Tax=Mytilus coruscus TaxID=42192 RepID=A0A6J8BQM3_MYTCO|nr:unnamed protein product [Mytilus coruscus]